ncbi:helix-turn-helix domain-containing protein [Streptomyces sp. NPDC017890]|uniref:helix-turn-helix domain-containing protein n=1 Tax=Streptomyces sp. NPDC017890 TaxID=3365015 RepID=UPI00379EAC24
MSNGNSPEDERPIEDVSHDVPEDLSAEARPSVGRALHQARIAAGLTVDDISIATRVRIAIVHAIEADDFTPCGGDVYARGHIRTLAKAVGLDPAELLAQFDAEHGGRPAPTSAAPLFEAERIRPERRGPNWTAAMVAAIVAVIGFVGFTFVKGGDDGGSEASVAEGSQPTAGESASPSAKPNKPADPKPDPTDSAIAAAPQDKVTVKVSADDGRSWISAKDHNGRLLFDGLLKQGDSETFQDNEKINLVLGDAGAIQLYVNGKKIEDDFQPGSVERLTYTKGDPEVG